jgi:hypothetical protein
LHIVGENVATLGRNPYLCLVQSMKRGEIPHFLIHSDPMFGYRTCAWLQCQPAAACLTGILSPTNRGFQQAIFDLQKEGLSQRTPGKLYTDGKVCPYICNYLHV